MKRNLLKKLFPVIAVLLLAPWPVAFAYDAGDGTTGQETIQVEAAQPSAMPDIEAFGGMINGVAPGDLFYIDATGNQADIAVTLHLTNAHELVHGYRYLMLKVGVYTENGAGQWVGASSFDGNAIPDTLVTLKNAQASFILAGSAKYKLTIDGGSYYCYPCSANTDGGSLSPQFFLEAE